MSTSRLNEVFQQVKKAYETYVRGDLKEARTLTLAIDTLQTDFDDEYDRTVCQKHVAVCLVDVGFALRDEEMVRRGTTYFQTWASNYAPREEYSSACYNLANGYMALWKLGMQNTLSKGIDAKEHRLARHYYREAIKTLSTEDDSSGLACEIWTNYGLALNAVGRSVEAIDAFDAALRIDPNMGMALANKALMIAEFALDVDGHTHRFYLEARHLLETALQQDLTTEARDGVRQTLEYLLEIFEKHGEMKPEAVESISPVSDFHKFLCAFCSQHALFLNPINLLGKEGEEYFGDPMFISTMYASIEDRHKFDRYITFLNEIKQDYVLGRFLLVQSQFASSEVDIVDQGVSLFDTLDYSLHSIYIQMLKAANKQAIAVLDKISFFIYDYCKLVTPPADKVSFRQIWGGNEKIRADFANFANPYLFALFNLSYDISRSGDWSSIYEYRDALTHRFLVLHDFQSSNQPNADVPREVMERFLQSTILAYKIARAAIAYLILFVEQHETVENQGKREKPVVIPGIPMNSALRYRPKARSGGLSAASE